VKEEFDCNEMLTPDMGMPRIFDQTFPPYLRALTEGVNVTVFMFGSTGSGKTHCLEGSNSDPGLASLIGDNLFNVMEDKRFRTSTGQGNFQF
jgi:hypothetical protein